MAKDAEGSPPCHTLYWLPGKYPETFMDNSNSSLPQSRANRPLPSGNSREAAASSIRYVGRKEAKVPLPFVLIIIIAIVIAIVAVRHYVQA
jgi:hypothetical protein